MKITFLGTSHAIPQADRYCTCAMIEAGGVIYFIDAGAPLMEEIVKLGKDIHDVRAVFATHCHLDHINGIPSLAGPLNWFFKDASVSFYLPEQRVIDAYKTLLSYTVGRLDEERVRFYLTDKDFVYEDENIRLSLIPTAHMNPSYAILVECEGKRVLFSGDLSGGLKKGDVPHVLFEKAIDLFVCELAHLGMDDIKPYLERSLARSVCFNHVSPIEKLDEIKTAADSYPFPIRAVNDRDEIVL